MAALSPPDPSLASMFFHRAARAARRPALRTRRGAGFVDTTYAGLAGRVEAIAAGLLARGVGVGEKVAVVASTRAEWIALDFAIMSVGAVTVPIYPSVTAAEIGFICQDAGAAVVVVENAAQHRKLAAIADGFTFLDVRYPGLAPRLLVVMDAAADAAAALTLADVEAEGRAALLAASTATAPERLARTAALTRASLATITYTSGTTGAPKGVLQTHGNWLAVLDIAESMQLFTEATRDTGAFLFLPLAHAFGRMVAFGGVYFEAVTVLSSPDTLLADLTDSRPGFVPAAPRVYEKIYARLMAAVQEQPKRRQQIFRWALSVGERTIPYRASGQPLPARLRIEAAVADRLVWRKLKARLGLDRVQVMLSGSAALSPAVLRFFLAINVTLVEAYGLTETSPGISGNKPSAFREGSVGEVLPGVRVRFADDGEILASGDNITPGYHRRPDDDARAFEVQDGVRWFRTGDIGHLDRDGYLFLTDRKKDLIKTSGGKFVAPQKIEGLLKGRPPITEAVVIGDGRKHCAVLVVVDEDALAAWAKRTGNKADRQSPALMAEVQAQVDAVNATLARYETLKQVRVLDDVFSVDNGLLTASFKVKRKVVAERYAAIIDGMFPHDDELA